MTNALAELRAELDRLAALTERAQGEHSRSVETLRTDLKDAIAALRTDIAAQRKRSDERHQLLRELVRALEAASTRQIDDLRAGIRRLEQRLDEIERGRKPTVVTRDARIIVAGSEKSTFGEVARSLAGTTLGAILALGSGWWLGRRTQKHSDEQKRLDVTIKVAETYLSPAMITTFSEAQGLVDNAATYNATPQEMNKVVTAVGFFRYICELKKVGRLDAELLAASEILDIANQFFATIQQIPPQCRAKWQRIIDAAQPCT